MFDPAVVEFGGVTIIALVFGLTQFFKDLFNLDGKIVTALAMVIGALVFGIAQAFAFLPEQWGAIGIIVYQSITFGLSAAGFYKFGTRNE